MKEYQIIQEGIVIGRFSDKQDRDNAFKKYIKKGYVKEIEK